MGFTARAKAHYGARLMRSLVCSVLALTLAACNCGGEVIIGGAGGGGGPGGSGGNTGGGGGTGGNTGIGGGTGGNTGGGNGTGGGVPGDGGFVDPDPDDGGASSYDGGCGPIDAGNPPYPRRCVPATTGECDGPTDALLTTGGVQMSLLNGPNGNGFDDDCDGEVDEGCFCPSNGQTKDCWLVPATQADPATKQPVGWCNPNAKGSLDCAGGDLARWSGVCRGANRPVRHDSCAPGDFNCDGLAGNSDLTGCSCGTSVVCPTMPLTLAPFPPPTMIPRIDGSLWITDSAQRANATGWTWTVLGGDCDNVLPFPTFALYNQASSSVAGARRGTRTPVRFDPAQAKYVAAAGQPLIAIQAMNYGNGVAGGQVHTAFGLSGDYTVQGEFDLNGQHYVCTQKVQVRAPGIRAELCWDSVGTNDIDLHFARLQGPTCASKGWDTICATDRQDCYYLNCDDSDLGWGYAMSPSAACHGWSSKRDPLADCDNPRLDSDNITCDRAQSDPLASGFSSAFCGPENINLDNPRDGDKFVVGVNHYQTDLGASPLAKPHVNLYCNGQRVLSVGYNPATGQTQFPLLRTGGMDTTGDFWTAAVITARVSGTSLTSCDVETVPSHHADATRDGPGATPDAGTDICVDSRTNMSTPPFNYTSHRFVDTGSAQGLVQGTQPATAAQFCKH